MTPTQNQVRCSWGSKKKEKLSVKMREDCVGIIGFQTWMLALVLVSARPWSITDRQLEFLAWGLYCGNSSPLLDISEGWRIKSEHPSGRRQGLVKNEEKVFLFVDKWEVWAGPTEIPPDYQVLLTAGACDPEKTQGDGIYVRDGSTKE